MYWYRVKWLQTEENTKVEDDELISGTRLFIIALKNYWPFSYKS